MGLYRPRYGRKKWGFPLWTRAIFIQSVHGWRLRNMARGKQEPYLVFLRELVCEMFAKHGSSPKISKHRTSTLIDDLRYDNTGHMPGFLEKGNRRNCRYCWMTKKKEFRTVNICEKCKVPLHVRPDENCFKLYHTKQ